MISKRNLYSSTLLVLCILAIIIVDYKIAGITSIFIMAPVCIMVGYKYIFRISVIKKTVLLNLVLLLFTLPAIFGEWFDLREFLKSLLNLNSLFLYSIVTYSVAKDNQEKCENIIRVIVIFLIGLVFMQTVLFYATGKFIILEAGLFKWAASAQDVMRLRGGSYRPQAIFTEPSHLCAVLTGFELYNLQAKKINMPLLVGTCLTMTLSLSFTGAAGVATIAAYIFLSKKEISKKERQVIIGMIIVTMAVLLTSITLVDKESLLNNKPVFNTIYRRMNNVLESKDDSSSYRFDVGWTLTYGALKENLMTGIGLGQNTVFADYIGLFVVGRDQIVLNITWYEVLVFWGILGLAIVLFLLRCLIKRSRHKWAIILFILFITITHGTLIFVFLYGLTALIMAGVNNNYDYLIDKQD